MLIGDGDRVGPTSIHAITTVVDSWAVNDESD
jgi:hypothetical protein